MPLACRAFPGLPGKTPSCRLVRALTYSVGVFLAGNRGRDYGLALSIGIAVQNLILRGVENLPGVGKGIIVGAVTRFSAQQCGAGAPTAGSVTCLIAEIWGEGGPWWWQAMLQTWNNLNSALLMASNPD